MFFTARSARAAEFAEENFFFIAAERMAMKNHSAAEAAVTKSCGKVNMELGVDYS